MSGLDDINIRVIGTGDADSGPVEALLREIEVLLKHLIATGNGGSIELSSMPLAEHDLEALEEALGEGEVNAEVGEHGTLVRETGIPGVWWISRHDAEGQPMSEFIEVGYCPDILVSPEPDVKDGLEALRARLFATGLTNR